MVCKYQIYYDNETNKWWAVKSEDELLEKTRFSSIALIYEIKNINDFIHLDQLQNPLHRIPVRGTSGLRNDTIKSLVNEGGQ
ncbi:hypothetical protein NXS15_01290 [Mycoplasma sp. CSL7475-4]|uniref:hypothetical protein n=1 Tax=Mycoplasma sp. CSL7475-4 TaxID=2973942 RepID=UPI00216B097C|nr:hypothetical protein [Mycoplasma sp. CSL7475-4]MCS4536765.1 hypothetical protein [Mycoplasma sp. CSL7475-4]